MATDYKKRIEDLKESNFVIINNAIRDELKYIFDESKERTKRFTVSEGDLLKAAERKKIYERFLRTLDYGTQYYKTHALENGLKVDDSFRLVDTPEYMKCCEAFGLDALKYVVPEYAMVMAKEDEKKVQRKQQRNAKATENDKAKPFDDVALEAADGITKAIRQLESKMVDMMEQGYWHLSDDISHAGANIEPTNDILHDMWGDFGAHAKNYIRASEEARAAYKTLEVIAESSIEISETLKKIDAKLGKLETRQEEMNQRLSGFSQVGTGISANVAKMVTFVDRFTKR